MALIRSGYSCNNNCRFCDQGALRHEVGDHSDAEVLERIGSFGPAEGAAERAWVLAGGEVTLRAGLGEWVKAIRRQGAGAVIVQTNGRMLAYRRYANDLAACGVDAVAVALHGHRAELHEWLTRAEGSYEQLMRGVANARRAGLRILLNTVVTRSGFRHLPEVAAMLPRLDVALWRIIWPRRAGTAEEHWASLEPDPSLALPFVRSAMLAARRLERRVQFEAPDTWGELRPGT